MERQFNVRNDPNAGKLIESLRYLGYDNYVAIADIVDNSLDAEAQNIWIKIWTEKHDFKVMIADDGVGMDSKTLDQALRLGSLTERNAVSDLGKFGMGLVTAGISLARKTMVVTRQNGTCLSSVVDLDEVIHANTFCKAFGEANEDERKLFLGILGEGSSGTVVFFENCDGIKNQNVSAFANTLKKHLGRIHRYFLQAGKKMYVNDEAVEMIDPLELNRPETTVFSDEEYPVSVKIKGNERTEKIRVRIVLIPEDEAAGERQIALGIKNQGFYILRNNREIKMADTLDAFTKHGDFNRMRGEVFLSGELDEIIGIDFTKREVVFNQSFKDQLLKALAPQCSTIKRQESKRHKVKESDEVLELHQEAEKYIDQKAKLLVLPKSEIEKRSLATKSSRERTELEPRRTRGHFRQTQKSDATRVKFECASYGPNGQIYECDLVGRTVVITWNIDHPFYQRFVLDQRSDGRLVTAVDYLVYSMASAELALWSDDNVDMVSNFKSIMSANVRTLLS